MPSTAIAKATQHDEKVKCYYVLAMVSPETKTHEHGASNTRLSRGMRLIYSEDVDAEAVPPRWPPTPESLIVDEPTYEVAVVPVTSIAMVSFEDIKVDILLFCCALELDERVSRSIARK